MKPVQRLDDFRLDPSWQAIESFELDDPNASLSFSRRLQRDNFGWEEDFTQRVVAEYRRFVYLMCRSPRPVTPSEEVDAAWHLHLLYSESYRELCKSANSKFINHGPTKGGKAQGEHFHNQYARTLEFYREVFGEEPPADIWPAAERRFDGAPCTVDLNKYIVVDPKEYTVLPRSTMRLLQLGAAAVLVLNLMALLMLP